jgi:hypothetical protein
MSCYGDVNSYNTQPDGVISGARLAGGGPGRAAHPLTGSSSPPGRQTPGGSDLADRPDQLASRDQLGLPEIASTGRDWRSFIDSLWDVKANSHWALGRDQPRRSLSGSARRVLCFGEGDPVPQSFKVRLPLRRGHLRLFFQHPLAWLLAIAHNVAWVLRGETDPAWISSLSIGLDPRCDRFGPGLHCRWKAFSVHAPSTHGDGVRAVRAALDINHCGGVIGNPSHPAWQLDFSDKRKSIKPPSQGRAPLAH